MAFTAEEEAALRGIIAIYKTQAPSLSDDVAEIAPALYDRRQRRAFGRVTLPQPIARTQRTCPHGSSRTQRTATQPAQW